MEDKAVHAVKKELEAFLTKALYDRQMFKRETTYTQREIDDRGWWDSMYTDIREYFLPLQVLQEYVAAGEELGDELA